MILLDDWNQTSDSLWWVGTDYKVTKVLSEIT